jgi:hypothetical protein
VAKLPLRDEIMSDLGWPSRESGEDGPPSDAERRAEGRDRSRPPRESPGRRKTDPLPRTTFTKKFMVVIVAVVNLLYLVGEAILYHPYGC